MLLNTRIPAKYIFNKVKKELLYVSFISVIVLFISERYDHFLPDMPLTVPAFIGTAISVLLSFKLNQSYDRWWEARIIWGSIVNNSRSLVLQLQAFAGGANAEAIKRIGYRQIAWCYCLGQSLRKIDPMDNLDRYVSNTDSEYVATHHNKPLALLQLQTDDIRNLRDTGALDTFAHVQLDETLVRLCAEAGKAERIKSTVFPITYRIFLHFIIYFFVVTLSLALKDLEPYFEVPLLLVLSCAFFLLERTATHMQDPFENRPTDTAVTAIAKTIEINIKQLLREKDVPAPETPNEYYLM